MYMECFIFQGLAIDRFRESQMHGKHGIFVLATRSGEQNREVVDNGII